MEQPNIEQLASEMAKLDNEGRAAMRKEIKEKYGMMVLVKVGAAVAALDDKKDVEFNIFDRDRLEQRIRELTDIDLDEGKYIATPVRVENRGNARQYNIALVAKVVGQITGERGGKSVVKPVQDGLEVNVFRVWIKAGEEDKFYFKDALKMGLPLSPFPSQADVIRFLQAFVDAGQQLAFSLAKRPPAGERRYPNLIGKVAGDSIVQEDQAKPVPLSEPADDMEIFGDQK